VDLTFLGACGFTAFGIFIGALVEERLWHLLSRPLPRPWRPVLRYLAPGTVWRDVRRCWTTGRWT
jgi:hypothetical protein